MKKLRQKLEQGFTLMEVMIGILIVNIGVVSMLTGVVHAHNILRSTELKERAFEEVRMELERWRGRIADGRILPRELNGDPQGKTIYLEGNDRSDDAIEAIITYDPIMNVPDGVSDPSRYQLRVNIKWQDFTMLGRARNRDMSLSMVMLKFE